MSNVTLTIADQKERSAESGSWGHKLLISHGFTCVTPVQVGFVRMYEYVHENGCRVSINTGINADYWSATDSSGTSVPTYYRNPENGKFSMFSNGLVKWLGTICQTNTQD